MQTLICFPDTSIQPLFGRFTNLVSSSPTLRPIEVLLSASELHLHTIDGISDLGVRDQW